MTALILGVLIPIVISRASKEPTITAKDRLIGEVAVIVEDAYGEQQERLRPGEQWRITRGASIIAEIAVTRERVTVQTEDDQYYLSFATGSSWKKIVKGTKITIYLYSKTWEEMMRDTIIIPLEGLYGGDKWITLTQSEKQHNVQVVLEFEPRLETGKVKSVDEMVSMLDAFYSDITNRQRSTLDSLRKLLLNE